MKREWYEDITVEEHNRPIIKRMEMGDEVAAGRIIRSHREVVVLGDQADVEI